jgi:hypothetical protein
VSDAGDVWAVVDDDADISWRGSDESGCDLLEMPRGHVFGAELD